MPKTMMHQLTGHQFRTAVADLWNHLHLGDDKEIISLTEQQKTVYQVMKTLNKNNIDSDRVRQVIRWRSDEPDIVSVEIKYK